MGCDTAQRDELQATIIQHGASRRFPAARQATSSNCRYYALSNVLAISQHPRGNLTTQLRRSPIQQFITASDATRLTLSYFVSSSPRGRVSTTPSAACRPIISDARVIATTPTDWPADRLDEQVGRCEGPAGERLLATVMTTTSSQLQQQRNDFYHGL